MRVLLRVLNRRVGGGGAKSKHRKARLHAKNEKLGFERTKQRKGASRNNSSYAMKDLPMIANDEGIHPSRIDQVSKMTA